MRREARSRSAFSLIEVLVAVVLLAFGIVATIQCLGAITSSQTRALASEQMQRLALRKYDELVALAKLPSGQADGDFEDVGEHRYVWRANRVSAGIGNLDSITVEVWRKGEGPNRATRVEGLLCRPASGGGQ